MSIEIKFFIPDEQVNAATLAQHMDALGFHRSSNPAPGQLGHVAPQIDVEAVKAEQQAMQNAINSGAVVPHPTTVANAARTYDTAVAEQQADDKPKRTRRTKAEIEAAQAKEVVQTLDKAAEAEERQITSSPEDRAQDEADEKAESQAAGEVLTRDSLREVMGRYVAKYGMPAAQVDGKTILQSALGPVPADLKDSAGKPVTEWKLSAVPEDQASLMKAIHAWEEAIETNPFDHAAVS